MKEMSVKVSNISKSYGKTTVLQDIGFEVQPGEIVGFLGVNGAGKSTCMKIITGWLAPDKGNVTVCGFDIVQDTIEAKRRMGYLPENNPLYPEMYVKEYLRYVAGLYRVPDAAAVVNDIIRQIQLNEVENKLISTLSKGYRQRVGLAQALVHNPEVLILDEPFSGLDPNQLSEIHTLIKELGKTKAILFSSHSLPEAEDLCDRVLILHNGQLRADAPTAELTREKPLEETFKELTR